MAVGELTPMMTAPARRERRGRRGPVAALAVAALALTACSTDGGSAAAPRATASAAASATGGEAAGTTTTTANALAGPVCPEGTTEPADAPGWQPDPIWAAMLSAEFVVGAHGAHKF